MGHTRLIYSCHPPQPNRCAGARNAASELCSQRFQSPLHPPKAILLRQLTLGRGQFLSLPAAEPLQVSITRAATKHGASRKTRRCFVRGVISYNSISVLNYPFSPTLVNYKNISRIKAPLLHDSWIQISKRRGKTVHALLNTETRHFWCFNYNGLCICN